MLEDSREDLESDQIWTLMMNRDKNGDHRLRAYCNDKLAINATISNDTCNLVYSEHWAIDIEQVGFTREDTASDFYRHKPKAVDTGINAKHRKSEYIVIIIPNDSSHL